MLAYHLVRRMASRGGGEVVSPLGGPLGMVARSAALAAVAAGAVGVAVGSPRPGVRGESLGVTLAIVVMVACGVGLVAVPARRAGDALRLIALLGLASAALAGFDPDAPGYIGAFVAVGALALRLDRRLATPATALIMAAVTVALALSRTGPQPAAIIAIDLGLLFVFITALFARDQQRLLAELREAQRAQAEAAVLTERARLAREIHDVLAHSLTGLSVQLEGARLRLQRGGGDATALAQVERAQALARTGLEEARRAVGALRGDAMPGPELLAELVTDFEAGSGIECRLEVLGTPVTLSADARLSVYRTAQEALTNIRKHSLAQAVAMRLVWGNARVDLMVTDRHSSTGSTDDAAPLHTAGGGYGLSGLRERAELLGGSLEAGPVEGGFRVLLSLPA